MPVINAVFITMVPQRQAVLPLDALEPRSNPSNMENTPFK
jgi:hypothetical protein